MKTIAAIAACLLVGLVLSRYLHIFHAVYDVKRRTYGEYFYPLAIFACALLAEQSWHFAVAILLLAVADGMAAVVGTRYKKSALPYRVWRSTKSVFGTLTYFAASIGIFILVGQIYAHELTAASIILLSKRSCTS